MCKTKPIARSGAPRRCLDCGLRPRIGVRGDNIADWRQTCGGATNRAKRTQFRRPARALEAEMRKTKPISGEPRYPPFHHSSPTRIVQNEPNLAFGVRKWARDGRGVPNRAKRTQFRRSFKCKVPSVKSGKPDVESPEPSHFKLSAEHRLSRAKRAKRTQFGHSAGDRERNVQNEANSSIADFGLRIGGGFPSGGADRAKRTQFRGAGQARRTKPVGRLSRYPTIPLFYYSSIPAQCRLCKTKPIG
jgi:hypothetical protein